VVTGATMLFASDWIEVAMYEQLVAFELKKKGSTIELPHPLARDFRPFHASLLHEGTGAPEPSGQYVSF
jgi:hypothetical protein